MSKTISQLLSHFILIAGILLMVVPIWIIFASSTHDNITILSDGMKWGLGDQLIKNYDEVLNQKGGFSQEITATKLFLNSFIMALGIATLTVITSLMSAFAIVYFRFKLAVPLFWLIFITLLVPPELPGSIRSTFNKYLHWFDFTTICISHSYFFLQAVLQICPR
jgi:sn-glycerol 3-phosphate transport system permease protein